MDDSASPQPARFTSEPVRDEGMHRLHEHLEQVIGEPVQEVPVDVRDYLLDPPPTSAELEQLERRHRIVRRGSIAATVVIGVLLVAPWPGGGTAQDESTSTAAPTTMVATSPEVATVAHQASDVPDIVASARRLDVPTSRPAKRARTPSPRPPRPTTRKPSSSAAPPHAPAPNSNSAPARAPRPSPPAMSHPPVVDAGVLIPVM